MSFDFLNIFGFDVSTVSEHCDQIARVVEQR